MATRKRRLEERTKTGTNEESSDGDVSDDILALNSDTEREPLWKRRKQIEAIAEFVRNDGELHLISTTLRGPFITNPWARRKKAEGVKVKVRETFVQKARARPKKARTKSKIVKDSKVDRYFPAQKNSQEREALSKQNPEKYAHEKEDPIVCDDEPKSQVQGNLEKILSQESPTVRLIPRKIDFDNIPTSADVPSQQFPTLQLLSPPVVLAQPRQTAPESISTTSNQVSSGSVPADDGLLDAPTPETKTPRKEVFPLLTPAQLQCIRNLMGDEPLIQPAEQSDNGLCDPPTPSPLHESPIRQQSTPKSSVPQAQLQTPIPENPTEEEESPHPHPHEESSDAILPASLTNRAPSFSPVKSSPLKLSANEINILPHSQSQSQHKILSPSKSPRQHESSPPTPSSHRQTTQTLLDQANESFNAIITPASLLPAPIISTKLPNGLTPFRELNASPPAPEISFRFTATGVEDSPLTYSPLMKKGEEGLWREVKSLLGRWDLDEEVSRVREEMGCKEVQSKEREGWFVG
jgi:hypothetical protein